MNAVSATAGEAPTAEISEWFAAEVQPHEASLRAYLTARFPLLPDIDDLVQETYVRVIRARMSHAVRSPKSLLFATARNAAIDLFRRQRAVRMECTADFDSLAVILDEPSAAESASHAQELELLRNSVRALPKRCRQVVTLRMIYGLTHREIAERLGIAENTVNNQLSIGLERCRQYLVAHGLKGFGRT